MKLHEYLKQFEGLDPEMEVYHDGAYSPGEYPEAFSAYANGFTIGYSNVRSTRIQWSKNKTDLFHRQVLILFGS